MREGSTIRNTRIKKYKNSRKRLILLVQVVACWYLFILSVSYLTSSTGAYFNDVEKISGTISVSDDYCKDAKKGSEFWRQYCKDNAGIGNGPDQPDDNTGTHTDPDNPGHNKGGCDDHTNAPCSDKKNKAVNSAVSETPVLTSEEKPSETPKISTDEKPNEAPVTSNEEKSNETVETNP